MSELSNDPPGPIAPVSSDDLYLPTDDLRLLSIPMPTNPRKVNKCCTKADLGNEATVEQFFVGRLLTSLGYSDSMIEPKTAVPHETIQVGSKKKRSYFPDYILSAGGERRWVCEAKASNESLEDAEEQGVSYCLKLRRKHDDPITHFMVTNGIKTHVFHYDTGKPVLSLAFRDFVDGNVKFEKLKELLDPTVVGAGQDTTGPSTIHVRRKSASEINADFAWCHSLIHRREGLGYSASFMELVKIVFLKLMSDKKLYEQHPELSKHTENGVNVPAEAVDFSIAWIEQREGDSPNPVNDLQFRNLLNLLEREIRANRKKRIFDHGASLDLAHATIKEIAGRLETADLLAIDADLNGCLFETFLNATLRRRRRRKLKQRHKLASRLIHLHIRRRHKTTCQHIHIHPIHCRRRRNTRRVMIIHASSRPANRPNRSFPRVRPQDRDERIDANI